MLSTPISVSGPAPERGSTSVSHAYIKVVPGPGKIRQALSNLLVPFRVLFPRPLPLLVLPPDLMREMFSYLASPQDKQSFLLACRTTCSLYSKEEKAAVITAAKEKYYMSEEAGKKVEALFKKDNLNTAELTFICQYFSYCVKTISAGKLLLGGWTEMFLTQEDNNKCQCIKKLTEILKLLFWRRNKINIFQTHIEKVFFGYPLLSQELHLFSQQEKTENKMYFNAYEISSFIRQVRVHGDYWDSYYFLKVLINSVKGVADKRRIAFMGNILNITEDHMNNILNSDDYLTRSLEIVWNDNF